MHNPGSESIQLAGKNILGKKVVMAEFSDVRYDARVLKQAQTLASVGYQVHLVMYNTSISTTRRTVSDRIVKTEIPFRNRYSAGKRVNKIRRLLSFLVVLVHYFLRLISLKADFYHAHNFIVGWLVFLGALIHRGTFIYDCHELAWSEKEFHFRVGKHIEKFLMLRANLLICPSHDRGELIRNYYNLPSMPISLYNYPNLREKNGPSRNSLRKELGLSDKEKILIYTGMLSVKTRLQGNVIKALPKVSARVIFVIIGFAHSDEISGLEALARQHDVSDQVFILPPKEHLELLRYTSCADIGISLLKDNGMAYRYHALNKFYEYVSSGLAVLASDFPTFRKDIFENPIGRIGAVCDEEDPASIAANIETLIWDNERLENYKRNSSRLFREYWNWEKQQAILVNSYNRLLR